jgi:hypothetical protein
MSRERDGFDIGQNASQGIQAGSTPVTGLASVLGSNPAQFPSVVGMTQKQTENWQNFLTGGGALVGAFYSQKYLQTHFGRKAAAALGGATGGYLMALLVEKLTGDDKK